MNAEAAAPAPLPKAPVLGWDSFWPPAGSRWPNLGRLPHRRYTSSGRAALFAALMQLRLPPGSGVLVPTYHCPTMIAPVVEAGLQPLYYPLDDDGLPALDKIDEPAASPARVIFVAHFFGLGRSLRHVLDWCRQRDIVLVEDCAHCYFGMAGERPAGHWGDYATASLSKFFPVAEGGLLASTVHELPSLGLRPPGLRAQLKAAWDPLDLAARHGRLAGLGPLLRLGLARRSPSAAAAPDRVAKAPEPDRSSGRGAYDLSRIRQSPAWSTRLLHRLLPTGRIVTRRRENYALLARRLADAPGARPLVGALPKDSVPYVLPLQVDGATRADAVYARLREERLPVLRWDWSWPGSPQGAGDPGIRWRREILQLLCHQDLAPDELHRLAARVHSALAECTH